MMRKIAPLAAVAAVLGLLGWGLVATLTGPGGPLENPDDRYLRQTRAALAVDQAQADLDAYRAQLARQEAQAAALLPVQTAQVATLTVVQTLALAALVAAVPLGLALAGLVALDAYRQRRTPLVVVRADGTLPVSRPALVTGDYYEQQAGGLDGLHRTRHRAARTHALPPQTFSPHYSGSSGVPTLPAFARPADGDEADEPSALAAPVPPFAALLADGRISADTPFVLGWCDGAALQGGWNDLYSAAVLGLPGMGKTTTQRFLAAQSVLHGARFLICDPHADAGADSLAGTLAPLGAAGCFLAAPASSDRAILRVLELAGNVTARRLAGGRIEHPLIVAIDEYTALMGRSTLAGPMGAIIEQVVQEGRKVGVYALISGQVWSRADRTGGTAIRDILASAYIHRSRRRQAAPFLSAADARTVEGLAPGTALLTRTSGDVLTVGIPNTTPADVEAVAARLARPVAITRSVAVAAPLRTEAPAVAADAAPPVPATRSVAVALADAGTVDTDNVDADADAICTLFYDQAVDIAAIMRRLYPDLSAKGPTMNEYQQRLRAVNAVIRAQRPSSA